SSVMFRRGIMTSPANMSLTLEEDAENAQPCVNPGNPVFSCMKKAPVVRVMTAGGTRSMNVLYKTTSSDYGLYPAPIEGSKGSFYPKTQRFSDGLRKSGMYCDNSFNTGLDRSRVYDCPNLQHTL
uniref:Uncharacterized protein n=1 Tax=Gouania willdenowi TaxID=441366 RepID=A0A8C5GZP0_GOUWI